MTDPGDKILTRVENGVAVVTLNRPKVFNALDLDMHHQLRDLFEAFAYDGKVRTVVITGAGAAFCAGGDIGGMQEARPAAAWTRQMYDHIHPALRAILTLEKPVIAMVNGVAAGAGCNLALACDLVIAADDARLGQLFLKLGLVPDWGGAYFLPRLVGPARAKQILFSNSLLKASEAESMGLISQVVPRSELETTVMAVARELAHAPAKALGLTKRLVGRSLEADLDTMLELEAQAVGLCMESHDFQEGVAAFLEKRPPKFAPD